MTKYRFRAFKDQKKKQGMMHAYNPSAKAKAHLDSIVKLYLKKKSPISQACFKNNSVRH
jgi:hypothetical protein